MIGVSRRLKLATWLMAKCMAGVRHAHGMVAPARSSKQAPSDGNARSVARRGAHPDSARSACLLGGHLGLRGKTEALARSRSWCANRARIFGSARMRMAAAGVPGARGKGTTRDIRRGFQFQLTSPASRLKRQRRRPLMRALLAGSRAASGRAEPERAQKISCAHHACGEQQAARAAADGERVVMRRLPASGAMCVLR